MASHNICKFVTDALPFSLTVCHFVRETDHLVLQNKTLLQNHRATLVTEGEGTFFLDGEAIPYRPGTLFFGFVQESLFAVCNSPTACLYIGFEGARAGELFRRFDIRRNHRAFDSFDGLIPLWSESLSRASNRTVDLAAESILLYTFSRLWAEEDGRSTLLRRMLTVSEERFNDPELSLSVLAQELSYNPKYLSHTFKEKMGMTYSAYLRTLRIKYALSLLDHNISSIKNVALLSGFSDPLYFSSVFKKHTGYSPSEYLKKRGRSDRSSFGDGVDIPSADTDPANRKPV